jgi:hypothetical protein
MNKQEVPLTTELQCSIEASGKPPVRLVLKDCIASKANGDLGRHRISSVRGSIIDKIAVKVGIILSFE